MNSEDAFRRFRFDRPRGAIPRGGILFGVILGIFTVMWILVPHEMLYWLLLPLVAILLWMAFHGWRLALVSLHDLIHQLEQHIDGGLR